jgi:hypothetical protein
MGLLYGHELNIEVIEDGDVFIRLRDLLTAWATPASPSDTARAGG